MREYHPDSVLVIIDAKPKDLGLPTEAYIAVEEIRDVSTEREDPWRLVMFLFSRMEVQLRKPSSICHRRSEQKKPKKSVSNISFGRLNRSSSIDSRPLPFLPFRDIRNSTVGTLSQRISNQLMGLKGLTKSLYDVRAYLDKVLAHKLPINHQILSHIQDIFNLLPDVSHPDLIKSIYVKTNDEMLLVYLSSLIRSIIALHNLIMNKIQNSDAEKADNAPASGAVGATTSSSTGAEKKTEKGSGDKSTTNGNSS